MSADEFDDLDDYIDDFVTENILEDKKGAYPVTENEELGKLKPDLAKEINSLVSDIKKNNSDKESKKLDFQSALNDTISRIKESSQSVDKESTKNLENSNDEELLTTLLKSLDLGDLDSGELDSQANDLLKMLGSEGGLGDGDEGDDKDITGMLMDALTKLTSKEMLYETISQSCEKYEKYFQSNERPINDNAGNNNSSGLTLSDYLRFEAQYQHLKNIKFRFESPSYSDDNKEDREYVDEEMEKYNNLYPPPEEVMDDNLESLGADNLKWGDKDVPFDQGSLDNCQQQ